MRLVASRCSSFARFSPRTVIECTSPARVKRTPGVQPQHRVRFGGALVRGAHAVLAHFVVQLASQRQRPVVPAEERPQPGRGHERERRAVVLLRAQGVSGKAHHQVAAGGPLQRALHPSQHGVRLGVAEDAHRLPAHHRVRLRQQVHVVVDPVLVGDELPVQARVPHPHHPLGSRPALRGECGGPVLHRSRSRVQRAGEELFHRGCAERAGDRHRGGDRLGEGDTHPHRPGEGAESPSVSGVARRTNSACAPAPVASSRTTGAYPISAT